MYLYLDTAEYLKGMRDAERLEAEFTSNPWIGEDDKATLRREIEAMRKSARERFYYGGR